mmetsp:Transcript_8048/g.18371  ORF Transcript_8048/g.18371 Transcript_8048/m.18371 type:complete len:232 (-) Transcript_8048:117-812(-)
MPPCCHPAHVCGRKVAAAARQAAVPPCLRALPRRLPARAQPGDTRTRPLLPRPVPGPPTLPAADQAIARGHRGMGGRAAPQGLSGEDRGRGQTHTRLLEIRAQLPQLSNLSSSACLLLSFLDPATRVPAVLSPASSPLLLAFAMFFFHFPQGSRAGTLPVRKVGQVHQHQDALRGQPRPGHAREDPPSRQKSVGPSPRFESQNTGIVVEAHERGVPDRLHLHHHLCRRSER